MIKRNLPHWSNSGRFRREGGAEPLQPHVIVFLDLSTQGLFQVGDNVGRVLETDG
jgi:hypothetical protein